MDAAHYEMYAVAATVIGGRQHSRAGHSDRTDVGASNWGVLQTVCSLRGAGANRIIETGGSLSFPSCSTSCQPKTQEKEKKALSNMEVKRNLDVN
jgi:hypothetical protein